MISICRNTTESIHCQIKHPSTDHLSSSHVDRFWLAQVICQSNSQLIPGNIKAWLLTNQGASVRQWMSRHFFHFNRNILGYFRRNRPACSERSRPCTSCYDNISNCQNPWYFSALTDTQKIKMCTINEDTLDIKVHCLLFAPWQWTTQTLGRSVIFGVFGKICWTWREPVIPHLVIMDCVLDDEKTVQ